MNANQLPEPSGNAPKTDNINGPALFDLGRIVATPGALALLEKHGIHPVSLLRRHVRCDWADMDPSDRTANANAVKDGGRVFSSFLVPDGHFKFPHLWPVKFPQAGRLNYQLFGLAGSDFLSW